MMLLFSPVWLLTKILYLLCINLYYWNNQRSIWSRKIWLWCFFYYLQKAFDTVDHNILMGKLKYYGVRGLTYNWFESYLKERKQYVSINGFSNSKDLSFFCSVHKVLFLDHYFFFMSMICIRPFNSARFIILLMIQIFCIWVT